MKTEEAVAARLRKALSRKQWRQSDLVRATGLDKNTISALVNAQQRASEATLGKIEAALDLTPGTLAGSAPEDRPASPRPPEGISLSTASVPEIMTELTYRFEFLKRSYRDAVDELGKATVGVGIERDGLRLLADDDAVVDLAAHSDDEPGGGGGQL